MDYQNYRINGSAEQQEIMIAMLSEYPFDSFRESEESLEAFIAVADDSVFVNEAVIKICEQLGLEVSKTLIPYQNWNKEWESNFKAIEIPNKCVVRANFHDPRPELQYEIIIDPKMAFGTGHHATTYMVMEAMFDLDLKGKKVFDYGCGTGILAILASKLGATGIYAIDNDPKAVENCQENILLNNTEEIKFECSELDISSNEKYDVILANINRNVLLKSSAPLFTQLEFGGVILLSGILHKDRDTVITAYSNAGFELHFSSQKDEWICLGLEKKK